MGHQSLKPEAYRALCFLSFLSFFFSKHVALKPLVTGFGARSPISVGDSVLCGTKSSKCRLLINKSPSLMENKEPVSGTASSPHLISDDTINFYKSPGLTKPLGYRPQRLGCLGTGSQIPHVLVSLRQERKAPTPEGWSR